MFNSKIKHCVTKVSPSKYTELVFSQTDEWAWWLTHVLWNQEAYYFDCWPSHIIESNIKLDFLKNHSVILMKIGNSANPRLPRCDKLKNFNNPIPNLAISSRKIMAQFGPVFYWFVVTTCDKAHETLLEDEKLVSGSHS